MENASAVAEAAAAAAASNPAIDLLPCHSFRSMLTYVDSPPMRSPCWLRRCMRAILWSALGRRGPDRAFTDDLRFPQFVHSWFDPSYGEPVTSNDRAVMRQRRDEERWGLYFGTKHLSSSDFEASLFYQFLDGRQTEDYVSFFFCVLQELHRLCGKSLAEQFVPSSGAYQSADSLFRSTVQHGRNIFYGDRCPQSVWVRFDEAKVTVSTLYSPNGDGFVAGLVEQVEGMSLGAEGRLPSTRPTTKCIDAFELLHMIMAEYQKESQQRRAVARVMFATASTGVLTQYPAGSDSKGILARDDRGVINFPQFLAIVRSLCPDVESEEAGMLYRESYEFELSLPRYQTNYPRGISFDSFCIAAEKRGFFSRSRECHILHHCAEPLG